MEYNIGLRNLKVGHSYLAVNIDKWNPEFNITDVGEYHGTTYEGEAKDALDFSLMDSSAESFNFENGRYTRTYGYRDAGGNLNEHVRFFEYSNNDNNLTARREAEKLRSRTVSRSAATEFLLRGGNRTLRRSKTLLTKKKRTPYIKSRKNKRRSHLKRNK